MTAKSDAAGKRYIELEIEVPGTPEQVWQAIATGPGFSAWFAPTEIEERAGGAVAFHMGPGMDSTGVVTAWEPPGLFVAEERAWSPGAPPVATEIHVEARSGGTCVVRIVNSLFASGTDWDDQLESFEKGWPQFLNILRLYLTHFPGQRCSNVIVAGNVAGPEDRAWARFTDALGLAGVGKGQRVKATSPGAPALAGTVERLDDHSLVLLTEKPGPGVALLGVHDCGGPFLASLSLYLYGEPAPAVVTRDEPAWRAWMDKHFPSAAGETGAATA